MSGYSLSEWVKGPPEDYDTPRRTASRRWRDVGRCDAPRGTVARGQQDNPWDACEAILRGVGEHLAVLPMPLDRDDPDYVIWT